MQRRELKNEDYRFIKQDPYQQAAKIDSQEIKLPFTNAYCEVALKKDGYGKWHYISRWYWCRRDEGLMEFYDGLFYNRG